MHPQLTSELVALRRSEFLHQAEQARKIAQSRSPGAAASPATRTPWRSAAGFVLVRLGMRLAGRAFDNPVVVVRRLHDGEQAAVAVIWNKLDKAA
ncbi:MAG TPA: hypothetical protein VF995_03195 [Actinomycetota bacterium]